MGLRVGREREGVVGQPHDVDPLEGRLGDRAASGVWDADDARAEAERVRIGRALALREHHAGFERAIPSDLVGIEYEARVRSVPVILPQPADSHS